MDIDKRKVRHAVTKHLDRLFGGECMANSIMARFGHQVLEFDPKQNLVFNDQNS